MWTGLGISENDDLRFSHTTFSTGFAEDGLKKRKYSVSSSSVGKNGLLMAVVSGEWSDCFELIGRNDRYNQGRDKGISEHMEPLRYSVADGLRQQKSTSGASPVS